MVAPTPSEVSASGPSTRWSRSPPCISASNVAIGFRANGSEGTLLIRLLLRRDREDAAAPGDLPCLPVRLARLRRRGGGPDVDLTQVPAGHTIRNFGGGRHGSLPRRF